MNRLAWVVAACGIIIGGCGSDSFNDVPPTNADGSTDQGAAADTGKDSASDAGNDVANDTGTDAAADTAKEAMTCPTGLADCDGDPKNGCEADTTKSIAHCGQCDNACEAGSHGTVACDKGACKYACELGWEDCDLSADHSCEVDTMTDTANCTTCGNVCPGGDHSTVGCVGGECSFACETGWGNCDGDQTNGCEVDTTTTLSACGTCGHACSTAANATPYCQSSTCGWTCNSGWGNCDNDPANGCELDTTTSVGNCGGCGLACGTANGTPSCVASQCQIQCTGAFDNCDGLNPNGCESDLLTDALNCGWCGHDCKGSTCTGGMCTPVKVADYAYVVTALVEYDTKLYFTADTVSIGLVLSVPKMSGTPQELVQTGNSAAIAVDASGIYWVGSSGFVNTAPLAGGTPTTLVTGAANGKNLLIDGANLFWSAGANSTVYRVAKTGGTAAPVGTPADASLGGLVVDDTYAYWAMIPQNSLQRVAKTGGTPTLFVSGQENPRALVMDGTNLYWTNYLQDVIVTMPKSGGAVTTAAASIGHVGALVSDGGDLYWTTSTGNVAKASKSGGKVRQVATGQNTPRFLVSDATYLYWVNNVGPGNVTFWRLAK
ncbi:MAG: hypothetical protein HY898_14235 [Deltaproteobacteria bacterium]|nr:hypothetical protein [Deltaproteobacteria bacterium]